MQERILNYWKKHGKHHVTHDEFDREAFTHANRNIPIHHQIWLPKWSCGICGVGKWLECWKEQTHSKCPRCLTDNETVEHVVHCKHEDATLCWNQGIEEIKEWMYTHNAIPGLAEAFGIRITEWRNQKPFSDLEFLENSVKVIIDDQDAIGWGAMMFGSVHRTWSREQGNYFLALGRRTTGTTWMSQLLRQLWKLQHSMWIHRNSFVHKAGKSMHQYEEEAVDAVIREEFIIGRNGLSQDYDNLFRGNVHTLLIGNTATKVLWIYRIWSGRDRIRKEQDLEPWYKNYLAATFIRRYQVRKKRKRRVVDVLNEG